ncbi:MAG: ABC transporter ATP-binding protein [Clostridia bacterium]|nr:ABC transporter ATP-binding protein [Clostridia bacterium]
MIFGKHVNRYYLRYGPVLFLGILSLVLVDYFQLKIPEFYNMLVNGINNGEVQFKGETVPFDMVFVLDNLCRPMIVVIIAMVVGRFLWRVCFLGTAIKVETDLRSRMYSRCLTLSNAFYQKNKVGDLMSLFTNDLETIQDCFGFGILSFFDALLLGSLAFYKMLRMNLVLTMLSMIPMVFLLIASSLLGNELDKRWDRRQAAFSKLSDFSQENFSGISVIKAFVKEAKEFKAFAKLNRENENANIRYTRFEALFDMMIELFVETVICVIIGYGGYLVHEGIFNAGQLIEYISYFTSIIWPVMAIAQLIEMKSKGKASLSRISKLLDAVPDVCDGDEMESVYSIKGKIEFRHLSFCYPDSNVEVLSDVSFTVEPGENVGIIGRTGAGKTTVADLILRTANVPNGTVFIDGHDVNHIPIKVLRDNCAYVPQDNFLFSQTIEDNISFAVDDADSESVISSAKLADIHDNVISFKEGYATVLGERGITVSGGQKQRISIARALMKDAGILILDDSVSSVDLNTEKVILENLKKVRSGKTTILIAHRVSTVEGMDKIIFMDEGRIIDIGTHSELYERCPDYRRTVDLQALDAKANSR